MKYYAILAATALLLSGVAFGSARILRPAAPASAPAVRASAAFPNEQTWLISEIGGAIWNISAFTAGSAPSGARPVVAESRQPGALAAFTLQIDSRSHDVAVTDYFWSPAPFVPLARALLPAAAPDRSADAADVELLTALTNPHPDVIQAQNVRVSALLRDRPRSAALHERAALLLGSLALRENAASMSDPRLMMARMTAHLAVARALDPDAKRIERALADAVLLTLVNRQRDGLAALDALPHDAAPDAVAAWDRALRVRLTKDWRDIANRVDHASLLEQREMLRALHKVVGDSRSTPMLDRLPDEANVSDWGRIIFHEAPTVGNGNRFADSVIPAELSEARVVRQTYPGAPSRANSAALVGELNVEPSIGPATSADRSAFWIIDWGTWAAASQRHLIAAVVCRSRHYWVMLDLRDEGQGLDREARQSFGGLRLFPLAEPYLAKHAKARDAYAAAVARAAVMAREQPALLTDSVLTALQEKPFPGFVPDVPPSIKWFNPYVPAGTAYEPTRAYRIEGRFRLDLQTLDALRAIAPYERTFVSGSLERRYGLDVPLDVVQRECADFAAYDLRAAWKIARVAYREPDVYVPMLKNIAETLNPDDYHFLGQYLAELHRDAEAEDAYVRYHRVATDPVEMANDAWWLILRYYETGRVPEALALGAKVADVGSSGGLLSYANILDLSGDLAGAEDLYRRNMERYGDKSFVLAFLKRHPERDTRGEAAVLTSAIFPSGVQPLAQPPTAAPDKGLEITWAGIGGEREGLRKGDIIVALDGIRVEDPSQYTVMKHRVWTAPMRFLVWRDKSYVSVETRLRHRWVSNTINAYPADSFAR